MKQKSSGSLRCPLFADLQQLAFAAEGLLDLPFFHAVDAGLFPADLLVDAEDFVQVGRYDDQGEADPKNAEDRRDRYALSDVQARDGVEQHAERDAHIDNVFESFHGSHSLVSFAVLPEAERRMASTLSFYERLEENMKNFAALPRQNGSAFLAFL
jgi:hypothetical protein